MLLYGPDSGVVGKVGVSCGEEEWDGAERGFMGSLEGREKREEREEREGNGAEGGLWGVQRSRADNI